VVTFEVMACQEGVKVVFFINASMLIMW